MKTNQIHYHDSCNKDNQKTDFLKEQNECPICNGVLDIFIECTNHHQIKEEARCMNCSALSRVEDHLLH